MDPRLSKAAQYGDIATLNAALLEEDPLILERVALVGFSETPLHVAALAGRTDFVKEMISRKPTFAEEVNRDGFSPLHIASAAGNIEMVRELLTLGDSLCLLRDNGGRTPLHFAAIKGRVHVEEELLSKCPQAIREVAVGGSNALHLAVKNNQFEAFKMLLEKLNDDDGELVNAKDNEGDTVLKLAMAKKQLQVN
ncbi:ankyrin repeat-containing protein BDA1-like [Malania oleifera]|uniref:ankyrin repeat-containing protein BDA1-like n=1 Tax=Malania oleifera TaxID=397392 RepID=UPI0025AE708E|nr:ankyrin repeat-containing protein BDA1-like [Malania oleifera]